MNRAVVRANSSTRAIARMMNLKKRSSILNASVLLSLVLASLGWSQTLDVSARVELSRQQKRAHATSADAVIWLMPEQKMPPAVASLKPQAFTLIQKDKKFSPHLLVIPTGSSVDFPNLDPFFHNVFSLFNGKRFDLGLYEAHTHRAVRFDREGVSYIFCNIHPEMAAVIITLSTPFYGISRPDGTVVIHNVPPGSYRLRVWAENVDNDQLDALSRTVEINQRNSQLGTFHLTMTGDLMTHHRNKFGEDYPPDVPHPY